MTASHCTRSKKPRKPTPTFPLFPAGNGQWAKRIRGKRINFGPWGDPQGAVDLYYKERAEWEAGRNPRIAPQRDRLLTVGEMVDLCLKTKERQAASGQIKQRTYQEYTEIGARLKRVFGADMVVAYLGADHFLKLHDDFAKTHKALASLKGDIRKTRVFFNLVGPKPRGAGYLKELPAYGVGFQVPSAKALRRARQAKPPRKFTAEQLRSLLNHARPPLRAMILLGINCAFGNTDCALLTFQALDLEQGWVTFPRPKTSVSRRNPLWTETVVALKAYLLQRPAPIAKAHAERVFITRRGGSWEDAKGTLISAEFNKVCEAAGLPETVPSFYGLRHTFVTVAKRTQDLEAVRAITGHAPLADDMLSRDVYDEETVEEERLLAVSEHVRRWLNWTGAACPGEMSGVVPFAPRVPSVAS